MSSIIYKITNIINNKCYIGQTQQSLEKRWNHHKGCYNNNTHFSKAIQKYGIQCWNLEILETINDVNLLNEREIYWISYFDTFNNGYNSTTGGQNTKFSEETKNKISKALKGKIVSDKTKEKLSLALKGKISNNKGKKFSQQTKEKMRISALGNKRRANKLHSNETKKKMSDSKKGLIPWNKGISIKNES